MINKNHYIPKWWIKGFANYTGKTVVHHVGLDRKIHTKCKPPKSTGYKTHLYRVHHIPYLSEIKTPDEIELIFSNIDNKAAIICKKIIERSPSILTETERIDWAKFIRSLIQRNPRAIDSRHIAAKSTLNELSNDEYFSHLIDFLPSEFRIRYFSAEYENNLVLFDILRNSEQNITWIKNFCNFEWLTIHLDSTPIKLIGSDYPVTINIGQENEKEGYLLLFALSPDVLFTAYPRSLNFANKEYARIAIWYNLNMLCSNRPNYVYFPCELIDTKAIKYRMLLEEYMITPEDIYQNNQK